MKRLLVLLSVLAVAACATQAAKAANLLTSAIQKFDMKQVESETLEYEWKEFLFHFYRSRLKEWAS